MAAPPSELTQSPQTEAASSVAATCSRCRYTHDFSHDRYLYANVINVCASLAYFVNDFAGSSATIWMQDTFFIFLASSFVVDALLYLSLWHGAPATEAPSALDISAEYANVAASVVYLAGTVVMAAVVNAASSGVKTPEGLAAALVISAVSEYLFLVEAVLYAASWAVAARAADAERVAAGLAPAHNAGFWTYLCANASNLVPVTIYAACITANIILFSSLSSFVRGQGRFFVGVATPAIGTACIVADGWYLADSLLFSAAWWCDVDASEVLATEAVADKPPPADASGAAEAAAAAAATEPTYNVFCPCRPPARCGCGRDSSGQAPGAASAAAAASEGGGGAESSDIARFPRHTFTHSYSNIG